tara:strand:+ start:1059 stop:1256 length:198 start_codon:yes stop_codon:yes gene_type:complete
MPRKQPRLLKVQEVLDIMQIEETTEQNIQAVMAAMEMSREDLMGKTHWKDFRAWRDKVIKENSLE